MDLPIILAQNDAARLNPKAQPGMIGRAQSLDQRLALGFIGDRMKDEHRTEGLGQLAGGVGIGTQQCGGQVCERTRLATLESSARTQRVNVGARSPGGFDLEEALGSRLVDGPRERLLVVDWAHACADPEPPEVALQSFGWPNHDHAMDHAWIEAGAAQARAREQVGGQLAIGVGLDQGDSLAARVDADELPVGVLVVELTRRRDGEQLMTEQLAELREDSVHRRTCSGLALDVDRSPTSQRSPDQVERLEWLSGKLANAHRLATVAVEAGLSERKQPALRGTDLLFTIPRDHVQSLGEVVGDGVRRERQRFQQVVL